MIISFFSWESRKSDLKRIWWAFLSFSDGEGFEWKPELKPQTWAWEQSMRWDVTGTEGKAVLQERMDKISQISSPPPYQFVLLSYFFSAFLLHFAFCLSLLIRFCFWAAICFFKRNSKLFCFVLLIYFIFKWGKRVSLPLQGKMNHTSSCKH